MLSNHFIIVWTWAGTRRAHSISNIYHEHIKYKFRYKYKYKYKQYAIQIKTPIWKQIQKNANTITNRYTNANKNHLDRIRHWKRIPNASSAPIIWVKWFWCCEYRTGSRSGEKKPVHLYSITLHLICGPFERKKKIQDTCTVLVFSFV